MIQYDNSYSYEEKFVQSQEMIQNLNQKPTDKELLLLYGLFKQATFGDVNFSCPTVFQHRERAKWHAWSAHKGLTKEGCKQSYIRTVNQLLKKYS